MTEGKKAEKIGKDRGRVGRKERERGVGRETHNTRSGRKQDKEERDGEKRNQTPPQPKTELRGKVQWVKDEGLPREQEEG